MRKKKMFNIRKKIGKKTIDLMKEQFINSLNILRREVERGNYEKCREQLYDYLLQGIQQANDIFQNPEMLGDKDLKQVINEIDTTNIQQKETKEFMERLGKLENNENDFKEYIDDFQHYYVSKLEEKFGR